MKFLLVFLFIFSFSTFSQNNNQEDPFVIEEEDKKKTSKKKFDFEFSGKIGGSFIGGSAANRNLIFAQLSFQKKWKKIKTFLSAEAYNSNISYTAKLRPGIRNLPPEKELKLSDSGAILRDAYLEFYPRADLSMSLGRQVIVWGQFDLFSPVDFSLPYKASSNNVGFSKANLRLPQDTLKLSYYPKNNIELQAYYFFTLAQDPIYEKATGDSLYQAPSESDPDDIDLFSTPLIKPKGLKQAQKALRIMFYPQWGTLGFTYYDGWDSLPVTFGNLERRAGKEYVREEKRFPEKKLYGVELSKPHGKNVYKFEWVHFKAYKSLDTNSISNRLNDDLSSPDPSALINWIENNNSGKTFIQETWDVLALGFDSDRENWKINLALFGIILQRDDNAQRGIELQPEGDDLGQRVAPIINIARKMGKDKKSLMGFALGFLGDRAGATFYFTSEYKESLQYGITANYLLFQSDEASLHDPDYETEEAVVGLGLSLIYNF